MALSKKPPVVTIMGHVDHGKTTLLDFIRKSKLTTKEFGEITQAIGAYQIEFNHQKITFIDTPGHEAFSQMRQRGAKVADLVVLVVAGSDGVMAQTKESLKIIKEAGVLFLVAVTKMDLPEASLDKVKAQLAENEVLVEGYGGNIVIVPVSAKTGEGIDQLLEMILLSAEMASLQADPEGILSAEVIETKSDKFCGSLVSVIVQNGTLSKGDQIYAGSVLGKVKMLKDEWGKSISAAYPGDPVVILGFPSLPEVGSLVVARGETMPAESVKVLKGAATTKEEGKERFRLILKTDVSGSLEAILGCLPAEVQTVQTGVGEINESDVLLAKTLGAEICAFNLSVDSNLQKLAETENVKIKTYRVIYDLLKDIEARVLKILEPTIDRQILGKAEIIALFEMKGERIAGCRVIEGKVNKKEKIMIKRGEKVLGEGKIISFKQGKQDINEADLGMEFGAVFGTKLDFQPGDMVVSYRLE